MIPERKCPERRYNKRSFESFASIITVNTILAKTILVYCMFFVFCSQFLYSFYGFYLNYSNNDLCSAGYTLRFSCCKKNAAGRFAPAALRFHKWLFRQYSDYSSPCGFVFSSSNLAAMVGLPFTNFFTVIACNLLSA